MNRPSPSFVYTLIGIALAVGIVCAIALLVEAQRYTL